MKNPSTRNLTALPGIDELKKICQSIATLDAIICPDWESRYYSYNSKWSEQEEVASMQNGSGDQYYIVFNPHGALFYGFAHESSMSPWNLGGIKNRGLKEKISGWFAPGKSPSEQQGWPGVVEDVPDAFREFISTEPVKSTGVTFCIWRGYGENQWQIGDIAFPDDQYGDGSQDLLLMLNGIPSTYRKWAVEYYEDQFEHELRKLPLRLVEYVYQHRPITVDFVQQLNPHLEDWAHLISQLEEIGYLHQIKS
jgi:hypothetical protein